MPRNSALLRVSDDDLLEIVRGYLPMIPDNMIRDKLAIMRGICTVRNILILEAKAEDFRIINARESINWYV